MARHTGLAVVFRRLENLGAVFGLTWRCSVSLWLTFARPAPLAGRLVETMTPMRGLTQKNADSLSTGSVDTPTWAGSYRGCLWQRPHREDAKNCEWFLRAFAASRWTLHTVDADGGGPGA